MEKLEEIWKPIKKYKEYYISNYGRVYNVTKQKFVPVKNNFVYVSKINKKGKRQHATLSVKRMLFEYFNINEYKNKPKKIIFLSNYQVKSQKRIKGKPIDNNFYNTMEKLENEYGGIAQIPDNDERLKTLWSYFN